MAYHHPKGSNKAYHEPSIAFYTKSVRPRKRAAEPTRGLVRPAALNPKCGSMAPPLARRPTGGPCHSAGRAAWAAANP